MWDLVKVQSSDVKGVEKYLRDGYEPFAVSFDNYSDTLWLKKEVPDEVHSKRHESDKGKGGGAAKTAKK